MFKKWYIFIIWMRFILNRPVRKADILPPSCAVVTKSGNLDFLEHFGPLQACNGTALRLFKTKQKLKLLH